MAFDLKEQLNEVLDYISDNFFRMTIIEKRLFFMMILKIRDDMNDCDY